MKRGFRKAVALWLVFAGGAYALALHWWGLAPLAPTGHGLPGGLVVAARGFARGGETRLPGLRLLPSTPASAGMPAPPQTPAPQSEPAPVPTPAPPLSVQLDVPLILQTPELPNGCEATCLAMALQYCGLETDKMALAYGGIPRQDFAQRRYWTEGGDPNKVYAGEPGGYGYYCFPPVLVNAANRQLAIGDVAGTATDASGAAEEDLVKFLADGTPVIVWLTVDDAPPRRNPDATWLIAGTEQEHVPYSNLHVMVMTGYDEENFYVCDPLGRHSEMPRGQFMALFRQMERRAVVIE